MGLLYHIALVLIIKSADEIFKNPIENIHSRNIIKNVEYLQKEEFRIKFWEGIKWKKERLL